MIAMICGRGEIYKQQMLQHMEMEAKPKPRARA